MNSPKSAQLLKLYKDLLRYGQQLKLTDKDYFCRRIKKEFRKKLENDDEQELSKRFEKGIILLINRNVQ